MRPQRLRLCGFGPFADTVEIDLDRVGDAGLFLLHGPTGAGKTTLLDGIGFALFGRVPGARQGAKRLRSDHAADTTRTEVELELSFGARRMRITRSPDFERPKKRGTGTTTEKGKVLLEELVDGEWQERSAGFDEAGQEIIDLVGMSAEQFFQVVLLPQGEFAQFLRAKSEDRAKVLQRLFALERFADVEQWLAARRIATRQAAEVARDHRDLLVAKITEVAGVEELDDHVVEGCRAQEALDVEALAAATARRELARAAHEQALALDGRQKRRRQALGKQAQLEEVRPALVELQQELDVALRAAHVEPVLLAAHDRRAARDEALSAEAAARAELRAAGLDVALGAEELTDVLAANRERVGSLEALRAVAAAHKDELAAMQDAEDDRALALAEVAALDLELASLPAARDRAAARARSGRAAAEQIPAVTAKRDRLVALRPDVVSLVELETALLARQEEHLAARQTYVALEEKALAVRAASVNSMIAKLAFALEDDTPCPVCGSVEHPDPSALRDEGVSTDDEEAARRAAEDAHEVVVGIDKRLAEDRGRAEALRVRVDGLTPVGVDAEVAELDLQLFMLLTGSNDEEVAQTEILDLDVRRERAMTAHVAATARAEAAAQRASGAATRAQAAERQLKAALGDELDLDKALTIAQARICAVESALAAGSRLAVAQEELDRALAAGEAACRERGFASAAHAQDALRDEEWRAGAALALRTAADEQAAVRADLENPELAVPLDPEAPVAHCAAVLDQADLAVQEASGMVATVRAQLSALERLVPQLAESERVLAPLAEQADQVRRLADLCAGLGSNTLRMTLSSFVLAARLEEVAAAASVRLLRMTQGRYELVHTDGGRGNAKAGLGLLARDSWSGQDRDTATLSGGETFLASLALALGLTDVVTAEAGGSRIEALFVDEGFGTLDEEALDDVMDVLDGLREGGRVVGVVSHVAELRQRIPAQIEVRKTRSGSAVVLHGC